MTIEKICQKIIKYSFFLLFFLTPLILTPWNYELFEFNKMIFVYLMTTIIAGAWLIKSVKKNQIRIQKTPLDVPIIIFLISQFLSFFFSIDRHVSIWGYYSRFHGGLASTICYIILYYAFVTNFASSFQDKNNKAKKLKNRGIKRKISQLCNFIISRKKISNPGVKANKILLITLVSGFFVSLYGILEHFGIDKNLWVQDVQNRVFSTLGQPNWLAAYLCILLPITIALAINQITNKSNNQKTVKKNAGSLQNFCRSQLASLRAVREHKNFRKRPQHFSDTNPSLFRKNPQAFIFYFFLSIIFYLTLLFTKSRSGFAAFWLSSLIFTIFALLHHLPNLTTISPKTKKAAINFHTTIVARKLRINKAIQPQSFLKKLLILNFIFLLITFFIGSPFPQFNHYFSFSSLTQKTTPALPIIPAGTTLETGGTESGEIRKIVWQGALNISRHFPFFGSGVETFAFSYYRFKPQAHNLTSEWDFLYNKAHNEYLNYAATTGFVGLGAYLLLIGSFLWWSINTLIYANRIRINTNKRIIRDSRLPRIRALATQTRSIREQVSVVWGRFAEIREDSCKKDAETSTSIILLVALLTSYTSILVTNFFGFSVVVVALFFWLIPAFSFIFSNSLNSQNSLIINLPTNKRFKNIILILIFLVACSMLHVTWNIWSADTAFASANALTQTEDHSTAYSFFQKAVSLKPKEPFYHDKFSLNLANLAILAFFENEASLSAVFTDEALDYSQKAITISPQNVSFWKTRTRLFYILSQINSQYIKKAIESLLIAQKLAPTDAKITYNLALLQAEAESEDQAIETLLKTIDLKPNYRDARFALAIFYRENNQKQEAVDQLKYILEKIEPKDEEVRKQLEEWE